MPPTSITFWSLWQASMEGKKLCSAELKGRAPKHHSWASWECCSCLNFRVTQGKWHISSEWPLLMSDQTMGAGPVLKACTSEVVEKRFICSIIIYWHNECSQGGNIVQNRNSVLGYSEHRGFQLWTAISSSTSENKKTQVFPNPKSEKS